MTTRPVLLAALGALVAALLFAIAGAHTAPTGSAPTVTGSLPAGGGLPGAPQSAPPTTKPPRKVSSLTNALGTVGVVAAVLATLIGIGVLLRLLWWVLTSIRIRRRRRGRARVSETDHAATDDDLGQRIDQAVGAGLAELEQPGRPVSDAIIACWLRLAAASAEAGVEPRASDTPEEMITRLGITAGVPARPLLALAELYREARFSRHAMGPEHAQAARAALTVILDALRRTSHAPA
jgi:hypothetical protein